MNGRACPSCDGTSFVVDGARGDCICVACGFATSDAGVVEANGRLAKKAHLENQIRLATTQSAPYRRETYFAERISQWRGAEPTIEYSEWRVIDDTFIQFTQPGGRWEMGRSLMTKDDCRELLWEIDLQRKQSGLKLSLIHI